LIVSLLIAFHRDAQPPKPPALRGFEPVDETVISNSCAIDWSRSAGVFIGVQRFHRGSDLEVAYAVDDAVDLAYALTREPHLRQPAKTMLLIAGMPTKESSRAPHGITAQCRSNRRCAGLIRHDFDCFNEQTILAVVRQQARNVGLGGVFVLSIATHGFSIHGEQRLLTADASSREPHGISLARILQTMRDEHAERILLFVDACRREAGSGSP
jgi:hypothetical protein